MKYKKIDLKNRRDKRGLLIPIEFNKELKTNIKRVFFIKGKQKKIRGDHAHKKCIQFFLQIKGKSVIKLSDKKKEKKFILNEKKKVILAVYPKTWVKINFLTNNNLTLVMCSHEYSKKDYITDFNKI
tara:strand:+ start:502 stop:882 length:381 start_codon:yes stop_codon:yes gene_type:complete